MGIMILISRRGLAERADPLAIGTGRSATYVEEEFSEVHGSKVVEIEISQAGCGRGGVCF
jgi:hypothetical protein